MNTSQLENWILKNYKGIIVMDAYQEQSFFYNPNYSLPKGIYFATIKTNDGPNDKSSNLNREGIFRLSIGIGKKTYQELFGNIPKRPTKGKTINQNFDFTTLGEFMPHPIYAWMGWVCINNPNIQNIELLKYCLDIAYQNVLKKFLTKK